LIEKKKKKKEGRIRKGEKEVGKGDLGKGVSMLEQPRLKGKGQGVRKNFTIKNCCEWGTQRKFKIIEGR